MMKLLILLGVFALVLSDSPNIPVPSPYGVGNAYVEPEHLLEVSLLKALSHLSVTDVDVDNLGHDQFAFEVEIYSRMELEPNFQANLEKALRSDLGFDSVIVKPDPRNRNINNRRWSYGSEVTYYVYFNQATMMQRMQSLAKDILATTNLSLEDSMWD